nr:MAG TPA: hypothetical protein [Caudoviricetes sp.]
MPLSKWTKSEIIAACEEYLETHESKITIDEIKKLSVATLKQEFLSNSSWHHTGALYNATNFYKINEIAFDFDYEYYKKINEELKNKAKAKAQAKAKDESYQIKLDEKRLKKECKELLSYTKYKTVTGLLNAIQFGRTTIEEVRQMKSDKELAEKKRLVGIWARDKHMPGLNRYGFETVEQATEWLESVK